MADIIIVMRHAAPEAAKQKRYWGKGDPGVAMASLDGVSALPALMHVKPERVLSSPLRRARLTAERLIAGLGDTTLAVWPELAEVDFGCFDGLTFPEVEAAYPEAAAEWARLGDGFVFPGGEGVEAFLGRVRRVWERAVALPERNILVVTHGGVLAAWDCFFRGAPLAERFGFSAEYAALTSYQRVDGEWRRGRYNGVP